MTQKEKEKEKEIDSLQDKRSYLKDKVKWKLIEGKSKQSVKLDVIKFNKYTQLVKELGVRVKPNPDFMDLKNYEHINENIKFSIQVPKEISNSAKNDITKIQKNEVPKVETKIVEIPKDIPNNNYILNLAWTETSTNIPTKVVNVVKNYFEKMGIQEKFTESNKIGNSTEHIIQYNYIGNDHSFNLLKKSAHYLLNIFSKTDFEKFNIDVYGKKII